jgi:uncharacterized protein (TIGR03435 family)
MSMLRTLLAERFKLRFHRETKELPVFPLVVGKKEPFPAAGLRSPRWKHRRSGLHLHSLPGGHRRRNIINPVKHSLEKAMRVQ